MLSGSWMLAAVGLRGLACQGLPRTSLWPDQIPLYVEPSGSRRRVASRQLPGPADGASKRSSGVRSVADGLDLTVGDDEESVPTDSEPAMVPDDLDAARIDGIQRANRLVIDRDDSRPKGEAPRDIVEAVRPGVILHVQPLGDREHSLGPGPKEPGQNHVSRRSRCAGTQTLGEARRIAREWWPTTVLSWQSRGWTNTPDKFEEVTRTVSEDDVAEKIPCGPDLGRLVDQVHEYLSGGCDHVYFQKVGPKQSEFLDVLANELVPGLRKAAQQ